MPHFENLDQYEAKNPKSGEKEIVPIAPHSMQAVDYRPRKREDPRPQPKEKKPAFQPVEFDPISVRQMEKEFRQAVRADARRHPGSGIGGVFRKIREFLGGLFGSNKKSARPSRPPRRRSGNRSARNAKPQAESQQDSGSRKRNPRRSRRPRDRSRGGPESGSHTTQEKSDKPSGGNRRNRNRRRRRPSGGQPNASNRPGGQKRKGPNQHKPKSDS